MGAGFRIHLRTPNRCRDTVKEHTRLGRRRLGEGASRVQAFRSRRLAIIARAGRKPASFRRCTTNARAELNWSNLHAGPDFVEAGAYAPLRRDAHAQVEELTRASLLEPFHSSNFEKSVLDRSEKQLGTRMRQLGQKQMVCS